jgi:hypothetical protein
VPLDEFFAAQVNLTFEIIPWPIRYPVSDKFPIPLPCYTPVLAKLLKHPVRAQELGHRNESRCGPVTALFPSCQIRLALHPHRIEHYVAAQLQEVGLFFDQDRFEPPLKQMAYPGIHGRWRVCDECGHVNIEKKAGITIFRHPAVDPINR